MDFKTRYPDFAQIEQQVAHARAERSVYLAQAIVGLILATGRGLKRLAGTMGGGLAAERDKRAIEADSFLKRAVPKY